MGPVRPAIVACCARALRRARLVLGRAAALAVGVLCIGALAGRAARAQADMVRTFDHTAWTARDGAPTGVYTLAQTPDGVLWLGGTSGLYRFDGVRFERFAPAPGQHLASLSITTLYAEQDGALWIGYTFGGASVLAHGRLTHYPAGGGLPPNSVYQFARDSARVLWAATLGGLARLADGRWQRVAVDPERPDEVANALFVDRRGTTWVSAASGVYARPRGADAFTRRAPQLGAEQNGAGFGEAADGSVWGWAWKRGYVRLTDTRGVAVPPRSAAAGRGHVAGGLLVDGAGRAWFGARDGRIWLSGYPARRAESATAVAAGGAVLSTDTLRGLTGTSLQDYLQDREGSVWILTERGLDRLRPTKLSRLATAPDLVFPAVVPLGGGRAWVGGIRPNDVRSGRSSATIDSAGRSIVHPEISTAVQAASRDADGGVWVGGVGALWHAAATKGRLGRFTRVALPPGPARSIQAVIRDRDGTLWLSVVRTGVFQRRGGTWAPFAAGLRGGREPATLFADDGAGGMWLGYTANRLAHAAAGAVRVYTAADGLDLGVVTAVHVRGDRVWIGGEAGLARLVGGRFRRVLAAAGVELLGVSGIVETPDGDLWLNDVGGIVRVPAAELRRADADPAYQVRIERFDARDGDDGPAPQVRPLPSVVAGPDGRLWFTTATSVLWIDPAHARRNPLPPPVQIRRVTAGGRAYAPPDSPNDTVRLPPRATALAVAYTALSLAVPERVRFRYQLAGVDTAWQDAGTRREAFYTNLRPGAYRFRVIAANEDGVWNAAGAAVDVVIPPTFVQTRAFQALCAAAAFGATFGAAVLLVRWRHRRATAALRARFEATLAERTRIAQELHDTLLQGFTGVTAQLHAVDRLLGDRPAAAAATLAHALATADGALRDARHAVWELRSPDLDARDLPGALEAAAREAAAATPITLCLTVDGARRRLPPAVETAAYRVGREAVANAVQHADARTIALELAYAPRAFTLRVSDDGRGFAPGDAERARRAGHWGVAGMRERARAAGGTLDVAAAPGRGTRVTLVLPLDAVG